MNTVHSDIIERYSAKNLERERPRTLEELLESVVRLEKFPEASTTPEIRSHLLCALRRVVRKLPKAARHHLDVAAYFKYKEREAMQDRPLHGKELEDWLAAEREIPGELERLVNELSELVDAELACAGSSLA